MAYDFWLFGVATHEKKTERRRRQRIPKSAEQPLNEKWMQKISMFEWERNPQPRVSEKMPINFSRLVSRVQSVLLDGRKKSRWTDEDEEEVSKNDNKEECEWMNEKDKIIIIIVYLL